MKETLTDGKYDTRLWPSDWRYSAAIVGLMRYFNDRDIPYDKTEDYIDYNQSDIVGEDARKNYLLFAEHYYIEAMHHKTIEQLLSSESFSEEQQKLLNEKLKANTICKKVFGKSKYPDTTKEEIQALIDEHRFELIQETFRSGKTMYAKFANTNRLFNEADKVCRLNGYYVDLPKKSKSIAYRWNYNTYFANDEPEFDFIVFAFTKTREGFFINNNCSIERLYRTNNDLQVQLDEKKEVWNLNPRTCIFHSMQKSSAFIDFNVEVVMKSQDKDSYETIYVRDKAIQIFQDISDKSYNMLTRPCRLDNGEYISCEQIVTESVLNILHLDLWIEKLLRQKNRKVGLINVLIGINQKIYGGDHMKGKTYYAQQTAQKVVDKLKQKKVKNKINSYRQKLISALCFNDQDKFYDILMNMAAYLDMSFDFAYDLFDDFDKNKNVAYAFINALNDEQDEQQAEDVEEGK